MANPIVLYKYRDWVQKTHQSLLKDYKGYFASPRDFNDPFDCRIYPNMYLLNTDEIITNWNTTLSNTPKNYCMLKCQ